MNHVEDLVDSLRQAPVFHTGKDEGHDLNIGHNKALSSLVVLALLLLLSTLLLSSPT